MAARQREWYPPEGSNASQLLLYNSLVDEKVPFVPAAGAHSKQLSWYACGPTVYDSAHMGHARNYVTFDIIRRVLEDYFGYNILYVMNVTDVDDKIILRSRRSHLLQVFKQATTDAAQLAQYAGAAIDAAVERQTKKQAGMVSQAASSSDSRQRTELEAAAKSEEHKLKKVLEVQQAFQKLTAGGQVPSAEAVYQIASDQIADRLDAEQGSSVEDPSIFRAHAAKYEREFFEDVDALGCRRPDVLTRVAEFVPEIISYVARIIDNGMAYASNGSVYFDTQHFREAGHTYGKCKPSSVGCATLAAESEANFESSEKRHPQDFALWKAAKPGEPWWDSPWGKGRPGWHIECSAMASSIIGSKMDIHTGGDDLKFPHHDNELAQAEAFYHCEGCRQWVNYFLHSGHLEIEGLKMSKSLKNFITIREALKSYSARQLRLMFVLQPWNKSMSYGEAAKSAMQAKEGALRNFFQNVDVAVRAAGDGIDLPSKWGEEETTLSRQITACQEAVHTALLDNINTPGAMDELFGLIKAVNVYLAIKEKQQERHSQDIEALERLQQIHSQGVTTNGNVTVPTPPAAPSPPQPLLLKKAAAFVTRMLSVFGVVQGPSDTLGFEADADPSSSSAAASATFARCLDTLSAFRDGVRGLAKAKAPHSVILASCDRVRDEACVEMGVRLEDRSDGKAVWKLDDPVAMRAEVAARAAEQAQAARKKVADALTKKQADLDKFGKLVSLPGVQETLREKYSVFDGESGEPTHDKDGVALEGKAKDKARKDYEKALKVREPLAKKLAKDPAFMAKLEAEVETLRQQLAALGGGEQ